MTVPAQQVAAVEWAPSRQPSAAKRMQKQARFHRLSSRMWDVCLSYKTTFSVDDWKALTASLNQREYVAAMETLVRLLEASSCSIPRHIYDELLDLGWSMGCDVPAIDEALAPQVGGTGISNTCCVNW